MFWRVEMLLTNPKYTYTPRYLFNPITGNIISNNSTNRKSVIRQIRKFRQKQFINGEIIFKADKINKKLAKIGRSDLKIDRNAKVYRSDDSIGWSSMVEATKNGKGRLNPNDALVVEKALEQSTGIDWRKDPIGNVRWFAGSTADGLEKLGSDGVYDTEYAEQEVALIACSKSKAFDKLPKTISAKSKDDRYDYGIEAMFAYNSPLFQKSLTWAENRDLPVEIMSAKYGLVNKTTPIDNYNLSLNNVPAKERRKWAEKIASKMKKNKVKKVNILGGKNYVEPLKDILEKDGIQVVEPLKGLGVGERLSFLTFDERTFEQLNVESNTKKSRKKIMKNLEEYAKTKRDGYNSKRLKLRRGVFKETKERDPSYGIIDENYSVAYLAKFKGE
tara:strand:+ start:16746 stop:17909 length:1164 start_codon:yes stop_codon:yes gene_type:complete